MRKIDLTGQRFGKCVVVRESEYRTKQGCIKWECKCDCGNTFFTTTAHLRSGQTKSCGCSWYECKYGNERTKDSRLYKIYKNMKKRCYNPHEKSYRHYGGKGITVCDEWLNSYVSFRNWAIQNGYADNLTIDRIDADGNYCPENCRWATWKEQANNTSRNHLITYNGETLTLAVWSERLNMNRGTLLSRIKNGWDYDRVFTEPVNIKNQRRKTKIEQNTLEAITAK